MKSYVSLLFCSVLFPLILFAQLVTVNNPSFEDSHGAAVPGWTLSGAQGGVSESRPYQGSRSLWIKGDGGSGWWDSSPLRLEPGKAYILSFYSRRDLSAPDGHAISGTNLFNVNLKDLTDKWQPYRLVVLIPENKGYQQLRFGQFESEDRFSFDAVRLARAQAAHRRYGAVELGLGERIVGDRYNFAPPMAEHHTMYFRPLRYFNGRFDSDRCIFVNNGRLEFEHSIAEHAIQSANLYLWTSHQGSGELLVEVSKEDGQWISLGHAEQGQKKAVILPDALFPAKRLCVRMRAVAQPDAAIEAILAAGQRVFGENRVQEAQAHWESRRQAYPELVLHLIGPLQTNKAADAARLFDVIQTLDREKLADALAAAMDKEGRRPQLLLAELDSAVLLASRRLNPYLIDRRPGLYGVRALTDPIDTRR